MTPALAVDSDGMRLFVLTRDRVVGVATFCEARPFELEYLDRAAAALADAGHDVRGRRFVEVGANIGTTTVPMVMRVGAAGGLAIEPEPQNARLLRVNLAANDLLNRVHTLTAAVADREGVLPLSLAADNLGDHRLATGADTGPTIDVAAVTLDGLVERGAIDAAETALVWVDVQGHEGRVLAGARRLREAGVPFVCEFTPDALRRAGDLDRFLEHASAFRAVVDVRAGGASRPAHAVREVARSYAAGRFTDLLLLP
jgi:FkbM family methyltransferase